MLSQSGNDELPQPGWCGAITLKRRASRASHSPPRLQPFAGMQEQQRRSLAMLLHFQRDAGDGDRFGSFDALRQLRQIVRRVAEQPLDHHAAAEVVADR